MLKTIIEISQKIYREAPWIYICVLAVIAIILLGVLIGNTAQMRDLQQENEALRARLIEVEDSYLEVLEEFLRFVQRTRENLDVIEGRYDALQDRVENLD